jgi:hypothetical protein
VDALKDIAERGGAIVTIDGLRPLVRRQLELIAISGIDEKDFAAFAEEFWQALTHLRAALSTCEPGY